MSIIEGSTVMSNNVLYAIYGFCLVNFMITMMLVTFIKGKIPEVISVMKAELYKRPWVHVHTSLNQLALYAPKRSGDKDDENCWDMEKFLGIKLVPNPEMVEHSETGRRIIHYYSKGAPAINAKEAAACRDVIDHLKTRGVQPTEAIIDALFIATDDELEEWYGESNPELLKTVATLKAELQTRFIHDGQFVWEVVRDFIFAASNETSRSLDEFRSIAHEQADERIRAMMPGHDSKQTLMYGVIIIFALAIGYKVAFAV